MTRLSRYFCLFASFVLLAVAVTTVGAQSLGPEAFGLSCRFGSAAPTTTRQLAMGVPTGCLDDEQFANPAFAAVHATPNAGVRWFNTNFDRGPELTNLGFHVFQPLHAGLDGLQFTYMGLTSSGGNGKTFLPPLGPCTANLSESAYTVDYGRRFGPKFTAGLSILGTDHVGFSVTPAAGPALLDVSANAKYGARVGGAYEWFPGDFLGMTYSFAQHSVWANALTPGGVVTTHNNYRDDLITFGLDRHVTPNLLLVLEFHHGSISGDGVNTTSNGWHAGAEYLLGKEWAVRAGDADGATTLGAGWSRGPWRLDYAYLKDWNQASMSQLFGSSHTHSLEAAFSW
jgi:hypothetical protein